MSDIQVYDAEGSVVTPHEDIDDYGGDVVGWTANRVRLVASPSNDLFGMYFRSKSSKEARPGRYYALVHPSQKSGPLEELSDEISQWSDETGEMLADNYPGMEIYDMISSDGRDELSVADPLVNVITDLADDDDVCGVIVDSCDDAIGLLVELGPEYDIVVSDVGSETIISQEGYDITIGFGDVDRVEPVDDSITEWNQYARQYTGVSLRGELTEEVGEEEEPEEDDEDGGVFASLKSALPF